MKDITMEIKTCSSCNNFHSSLKEEPCASCLNGNSITHNNWNSDKPPRSIVLVKGDE